jgi:hypothetical protein
MLEFGVYTIDPANGLESSMDSRTNDEETRPGRT